MLRKHKKFTQILDRNSKLEGDLSFAGSLLIEGNCSGNIYGSGNKQAVVVKGQAKGHIYAKKVFVMGTVKGNIEADVVVIRPQGIVLGDVHVRSFYIEPKGEFYGSVVMLTSRQTNEAPDPPKNRNDREIKPGKPKASASMKTQGAIKATPSDATHAKKTFSKSFGLGRRDGTPRKAGARLNRMLGSGQKTKAENGDTTLISPVEFLQDHHE